MHDLSGCLLTKLLEQPQLQGVRNRWLLFMVLQRTIQNSEMAEKTRSITLKMVYQRLLVLLGQECKLTMLGLNTYLDIRMPHTLLALRRRNKSTVDIPLGIRSLLTVHVMSPGLTLEHSLKKMQERLLSDKFD